MQNEDKDALIQHLRKSVVAEMAEKLEWIDKCIRLEAYIEALQKENEVLKLKSLKNDTSWPDITIGDRHEMGG